MACCHVNDMMMVPPETITSTCTWTWYQDWTLTKFSFHDKINEQMSDPIPIWFQRRLCRREHKQDWQQHWCITSNYWMVAIDNEKSFFVALASLGPSTTSSWPFTIAFVNVLILTTGSTTWIEACLIVLELMTDLVKQAEGGAQSIIWNYYQCFPAHEPCLPFLGGKCSKQISCQSDPWLNKFSLSYSSTCVTIGWARGMTNNLSVVKKPTTA